MSSTNASSEAAQVEIFMLFFLSVSANKLLLSGAEKISGRNGRSVRASADS